MANERGKALDKTHLSIDQAEERGFIHRDYIAHCLRWSHVAKYLAQQGRYKTAAILDVGCGKELPLAKLLYSSRYIPSMYVGIDANKLESFDMAFNFGKMKPHLLSGIFPQDLDKVLKVMEGEFDVITCFEVAEHIEPAHTLELLRGIKRYLKPGGMAFLSTPCYDPEVGAAANHVNEMSHEAFGAMILHAGLQIDRVFGTFASMKDYRDELQANGLEMVFAALRDYYDSNYISTIFAPLFPRAARNCLWRVVSSKGFQQFAESSPYRKLKELYSQEHSSSALWTKFVESL